MNEEAHGKNNIQLFSPHQIQTVISPNKLMGKKFKDNATSNLSNQ